MTTTTAPPRIFGSGIKRREDPRLLTGTAKYTDDIALPRLVHAVVLRSPHAHARITRVDTTRAKTAPGVVGVFTGADVGGMLQPIPCCWLLPGSELKTPPYQALATDVVRYVGDAVAVVVAESPHQAHDALELIAVDYAPLPAVVDPKKAAESGAPERCAAAP
jgi:aerobic carbon-monoxide dehydrogenase large subunit